MVTKVVLPPDGEVGEVGEGGMVVPWVTSILFLQWHRQQILSQL